MIRMKIYVPTIEKPLFKPAKLAQLDWLWADDRRLEKLFDWLVAHGQGPGTSAALADIYAKSQGAGP